MYYNQLRLNLQRKIFSLLQVILVEIIRFGIALSSQMAGSIHC
jgi:hypothetical protein